MDVQKTLVEQDFDVHAFIRTQDVLTNFMHYDLVVLDIKMPNNDGIKLYRQLRTVDKNVKVCFITASEEYYIERFPELMEEKCFFMQDPISLDNFVDRVKLALSESTIWTLYESSLNDV